MIFRRVAALFSVAGLVFLIAGLLQRGHATAPAFLGLGAMFLALGALWLAIAYRRPGPPET